ncbi:MAG: exopolysaccharide Pel transporter PelG, partial [Nitrospirota bacterium]|nr:exopolysaccharide Pel transporter PelG [Nitrospirota bacterium]
MAGIGFELRKILRKENYWSVFQAYGYAGVISSGPWILSILGLLVIGLSSVSSGALGVQVAQFQISVTYLIATSLILTGFIQSSFTRFVADRLFEKQDQRVLPNFHGVVSLVTMVAAFVGTIGVLLLFPMQSITYRVLMVGSFVVLANVWVGTIFLSGI